MADATSHTDDLTSEILPAEPNELRIAVGDVLYQLRYDLHETPRHIRDALQLGPLAIAKALSSLASSRPSKLASVIFLGIGALGWTVLSRARPKARITEPRAG